mmetsp:Transcript_83727/g.223976  ORF Transcript_83727/g.223976 Transcript_83727/m.223976 type:complete len:398 (-) Transcript_83727:1364-2557(-)
MRGRFVGGSACATATAGLSEWPPAWFWARMGLGVRSTDAISSNVRSSSSQPSPRSSLSSCSSKCVNSSSSGLGDLGLLLPNTLPDGALVESSSTMSSTKMSAGAVLACGETEDFSGLYGGLKGFSTGAKRPCAGRDCLSAVGSPVGNGRQGGVAIGESCWLGGRKNASNLDCPPLAAGRGGCSTTSAWGDPTSRFLSFCNPICNFRAGSPCVACVGVAGDAALPFFSGAKDFRGGLLIVSAQLRSIPPSTPGLTSPPEVLIVCVGCTPLLKTALISLSLSLSIAWICRSVPLEPIRYVTTTRRSWPTRCTRSSACAIMPRDGWSSANITQLDAVKVIPVAHAVTDSNATCASPSWNAPTAIRFSSALELPSTRTSFCAARTPKYSFNPASRISITAL